MATELENDLARLVRRQEECLAALAGQRSDLLKAAELAMDLAARVRCGYPNSVRSETIYERAVAVETAVRAAAERVRERR